jgi:NodT family efflux transporter outer membrane factor (OMF) lipoprotein
MICAASSALLAGCMVGPDFHPPAAPTLASYTRQPLPSATAAAPVAGGEAQRFSAALDVSGRWWEGFGSPKINALVERALAANPDIVSAQAALRAAHETLLAQKGALYPTITAGFTPSVQKNPGVLASPLASNANYFTLYTAEVAVAYTPDVFGGIRRQIETTAAQEDAQRYALEATYLTLTSNVVAGALQGAALRGQIRATRQAIATGETILADLRQQQRAGEAAAGDVVAQESALAQTRQTLPPLLKALAIQQDALDELTGGAPAQTPDDDIDLDSLRLPAELPLSVPSKLVEQRPDIWRAANAQVGAAIADRLPSFPLTLTAGSASTDFDGLFTSQNLLWNLSGGITQSVFDGGVLKHRQRAAEAARDQAAAQYVSTVHVAFQNVADALQGLDQDAEALRMAAEGRDAAAHSLAIARQQQHSGEVSTVVMLNAQQADSVAQVGLAQAQGARYADTVALYQALGGGWWNRRDVAQATTK